jgi:hypothetical protein
VADPHDDSASRNRSRDQKEQISMNPLVRRFALLLATVIVPACALVLNSSPADAKTWAVPAPNYSVDPLLHPGEYANRVMVKINKIRANRGLAKVKVYQGCLDHKSNTWAAHLSVIDELVHRNQPRILKDCNLHWTGECLVSGTALRPGAAVTAWMHSAEHRPILMKKRANLGGMGVAITPVGKVFVVLNFGDPT